MFQFKIWFDKTCDALLQELKSWNKEQINYFQSILKKLNMWLNLYRGLVVQFYFSGRGVGGGGGGQKQYYLYIRLPALYHLALRQNDDSVSSHTWEPFTW